MADRLYGAGLADFIVALGEEGFVYSDPTTATTKTGRNLLVQTPTGVPGDEAITVKVFDSIGGTQLTELYDSEAAAVTVLTVPTVWANLGQILQFTVRDTDTQTPPEGDVWLTTNELTGPWARAVPFTAELFQRLAAAEGTLAELETASLADVSDTPPTDGQILIFNNATGQYEPAAPAGTGTVTAFAGVAPVAGNIPLADALAALGLTNAAAELADIKASCKAVRKQGSGGYPAKGIFTYAEYQGQATPSTGVVDGDTWLQPAS